MKFLGEAQLCFDMQLLSEVHIFKLRVRVVCHADRSRWKILNTFSGTSPRCRQERRICFVPFDSLNFRLFPEKCTPAAHLDSNFTG